MLPPTYPRDKLRRGKTAIVILELMIEPGSERYRIGRTWLDGEPAGRRSDFVAAAMDAVEKWPAEHSVPEARMACTTIQFTLQGPRKPPSDDGPCVRTYSDGFSPPKLVTDPLKVGF